MADPKNTIPDPTEKEIQRFNAKVKTGHKDECWEWQASTIGDGYGGFWYRGRTICAHRFAYAIHFKEDPSLQVLHHCDNPPCCNPHHLFQGTTLDNQTDAKNKGRTCKGERSVFHRYPEKRPTGERNGAYTHPESRCYGERNGNVKTTKEMVLKIREMAANGTAQNKLAEMFQLSCSRINQIVKRLAWKHV